MNKKQRQTLQKIFEKPGRSDISWKNIEGLFIVLGAEVTEGKGSRVRVALNDIRAVFHRPHSKGSRKNNFAELALRFGSGLADPREQNHRNSWLFRGFCD